jgi:hypothetical protein
LVPPTEHIQGIASALEVPDVDVRATTYIGELDAIYPDPKTSSYIGKNTYPTHRRLGTKPGVHVCPLCLGEDGNLIRRTHWLAGLSHCPTHHVMLRDHCTCGSRLSAFPSGPLRQVALEHWQQKPFSCTACGLDWKDLPCDRADSDTLQREEHLLSFYAMFFTASPAKTYDRALALLYLPPRPKRKNALTIYMKPPPAPISVLRVITSLARHGYSSSCLTSTYFRDCRNRYVTLRARFHQGKINPPRWALDQPCPCGDWSWRARLNL